LVTPDLDKEMRVEADVSDFATGEVLSMKCEDERWRPVAYISKSLNEAERNYEIHNKEMLAIIRCLEAWRYFLEGAKGQFKIWTNHKNLEYFMKAQKLNRRQARWSLYLSRFDFALKHVAGKSIERADSLSRRVDWAEGMEKDNENQVMLKEKWLEVRVMEQLVEVSRSLTMDLTFIFIFISYFIFYFFSFSIFRTTRVRSYQSHCHISYNLMA